MSKDMKGTVDAKDVVDDLNPSPMARKLEKDNKDLRRRVEGLKLEIGEHEAVFETIRREFKSIELAAPSIYVPTATRGGTRVSAPVSAVMVLSDWHIGEDVRPDEIEDFNQFDWAIAQKRAYYLQKQFVNWVAVQRTATVVDELVVIVAGDMISGDIHLELQVTNEFPVPVQSVRAGVLVAKTVAELAAHFKRVRVEFITADNHGRLTKKPQWKEGGLNSYGYIVGWITKERLEGVKNVTVNLHCNVKTLVEIQGFKYLCMHGHNIKGWAGFPWYGTDRQVAREAKARRRKPSKNFDKCIIGHFHAPLWTTDYIVNGCFPAGMEVAMWDGTRKPIEKVVVGDMVLSRGGSVNRVANLFRKDHMGSVTAFRVGGRYNEVRCTDNHKIWGFKRNRIQSLDCDKFHRSDLKGGFDGSHVVPQWIPAGMLGDGDYVNLPYPKFEGEEWDLDFCRFIGLYLAEGSASGRDGKLHHIDFTFSEKEEEYAEFARAMCVKMWGRARKFLRVRNNGKESRTWNVSCSSSKAAEEMVMLCGKGAKNKIMCPDLMGLSRRCHAQVLGGWVQGDGHISTGRIEKDGRVISSTSISKNLADQMFVISLRAGAIPSLLRLKSGGPRRKNDCYTLRWGSDSAALVAGLTNEKFNGRGKVNRSGAMWIGDDAFVPLKLVGSERFDGEVFNLTVENDHSYSVNGVGVANSLTGTTELDHAMGRDADPCQVAFLVHPKYGEMNKIEFQVANGDKEDFGGAEIALKEKSRYESETLVGKE